MIYRGEDDLQRFVGDGKITEHDADEVRTFAAFLQAVPPRAERGQNGYARRFEAALREHYPDDPTLAALDAERRAQATQEPGGDENSPPDGPAGRPGG